MKKRFTNIVLVLTLAAAVTGCGGGKTAESEPSARTQSADGKTQGGQAQDGKVQDGKVQDSQTQGDQTASSDAQEPIVIKFGIGSSQSEPIAEGIRLFESEVEKNSNGQMEVEIYWDNQLGDATQAIPEIVKGNYEMTCSGATYIAEYMPELGFLNMGYLYRDFDHAQNVINGEVGAEIFERIADETGFRPLSGYYFGARNVCLTMDKEVKSPADLKGVKMRTNGTEPMMFLLSAMGSNPIGISYSEMYTALQTGTVDGQENPINTVVSQKLYEVSKSLTYTRHFIDFTWFSIGDEFFKGLSPENQQIIRDASKAASEKNNEMTLSYEKEAEDFLKEKGIKIYSPDITPIRDAVLAAYEEKAKQDQWDMELFERIQAAGEQ